MAYPHELAESMADTLRSMSGNAGQDGILDDALPNWVDWAAEALNERHAPNYEEMIEKLELREDEVNGTKEIWAEAHGMMTDAWRGAETGRRNWGRGRRGMNANSGMSRFAARTAERAERSFGRGGGGRR